MKKLAAGIAAAAALLLAPAAGSAFTPSGAIVAAGDQYLPQVLVVGRGAAVDFANADIRRHSVTSVDAAASGDPLFDSGVIEAGQTARVAGAESLPANLAGYRFRCRIHPDMTGLLVVVPS